MPILTHLKKEQQQIEPLFNGSFIENKPIPFPQNFKTLAYSNIFYWAHLEAKETAEFPLHPHEGFEIMTFVFNGTVEHFDTATNVWTCLNDGDIQVIQSNSGVKHAERITKGTRLFQIWFDPNFSKTLKLEASYRDYKKDEFLYTSENGVSRLKYLEDKGPINFITSGLSIQKLVFESGEYVEELDSLYTYSFYLINGKLKLDNSLMLEDDFLVLYDIKSISISVNKSAELFYIKSLTKIDYERFIQRYN